MMGRKKTENTQVSTIIGQGVEIIGNVNFSGGLHVDGLIKGNVSAVGEGDAAITLSELGAIEGEVHVPIIILNGAIRGDVYASERIELASKARVNGNVVYNLIEMAVGAEVNGKLMRMEEQADIASINETKSDSDDGIAIG